MSTAVFSPDGTQVVTASQDRTARIWETASGRLLQTLKGHTDNVWGAVFSPDGGRVLTASRDDTARIWDAGIGRLLRTLTGHTNSVSSALFSPDGKLVVTAGFDMTARIWETASGRLLHTLYGHTGTVLTAEFSPNGKLVVTASYDHTARIWETESSRLLRTLRGHADYVNTAVFSPDGTRVVTASQDGTARIWATASGHTLQTLRAVPVARTYIYDLRNRRVGYVSPDDQGYWDGSWDQGQCVWAYRASGKTFFSGCESPTDARPHRSRATTLSHPLERRNVPRVPSRRSAGLGSSRSLADYRGPRQADRTHGRSGRRSGRTCWLRSC